MAATTPVTGGRLPAAFGVIANDTTHAAGLTLDAAMMRDFVGRMVLQAMALADESKTSVAAEVTVKLNKITGDIEEARSVAGRVNPEMVANLDERMAVLDAGLRELTEVELPKVVSMLRWPRSWKRWERVNGRQKVRRATREAQRRRTRPRRRIP